MTTVPYLHVAERYELRPHIYFTDKEGKCYSKEGSILPFMCSRSMEFDIATTTDEVIAQRIASTVGIAPMVYEVMVSPDDSYCRKIIENTSDKTTLKVYLETNGQDNIPASLRIALDRVESMLWITKIHLPRESLGPDSVYIKYHESSGKWTVWLTDFQYSKLQTHPMRNARISIKV